MGRMGWMGWDGKGMDKDKDKARWMVHVESNTSLLKMR